MAFRKPKSIFVCLCGKKTISISRTENYLFWFVVAICASRLKGINAGNILTFKQRKVIANNGPLIERHVEQFLKLKVTLLKSFLIIIFNKN